MMTVSMKFHSCARNLVNFCIYKNSFSIKYLRKLHNFSNSSFCNERCNLYNFPQLHRIDTFSTTRILSKIKGGGKDKKKPQVVHINPDELSEVVNVDRMNMLFDKAFEDYKNQLTKHIGLRTSVGAVEELIVKFDGTEYQLQEIVEISRKPKIIVMNMSAFPQIIPDVLNTLSKSQMNLNPQQDGTTLYIPIPKVTKEYRETLAKTAKRYFVKCKEDITDVRNMHIKSVKKKEKLSEDLVFRIENYINNLSREYIDNAEKLLQTKEKELLRES
ncbi:mitochondrial ribosome recycling factor 1 [Halictus rubicundus]|uniref:mitochondrial ribosome recycling factor 1 n=1 Tax=Halictus rubicundus TaxID=77578 RepID=UPI004035E962